MKKIKPKKYTKAEKTICDCTDNKNYLIYYRMLFFYDTHGMIVDKIHEKLSFKQSKLLEISKLISLHKKEIRLKMILKRTL